MLKFFATGEDFKPKPEIKLRVPRLASPGEGAKIYERNYLNQFDFEFKPTVKREYPKEHYKTNFKFHNTDYSTRNYYNCPQSNSSSLYNQQDEYNKKQGHVEHYIPLHYENYKLLKTKYFIKQAEKPNVENHGNIVDKHTYQTEMNNEEANIPNNKKKIASKNMFELSKPLLRLDDEPQRTFKMNPLQISKDTPEWCQTYSRFYTEENLENAKRLGRRKQFLKSDIFGNKLHDEKPSKTISFSLIPPPIDSRYEKPRMGVIDKKTKEEKEAYRKNTKEYFKWIEDPSKQKYELKAPQKIGFSNAPFIKKLREQNAVEKPLKIGIPEKPCLIHKEKAVQVKIGHGEPEFLGKK